MLPLTMVLLGSVGVAEWDPVRVDAEGVPLPPGVLRRLDSGKLRHGQRVHSLHFTPDDKHLITLSEDGTVKVWNTADGRHVATHVGTGYVIASGVSQVGLSLVTKFGNDYAFRQLDVLTGRVLQRKPLGDGIDAIALSADGTKLAVRFGAPYQVFDTTTWQTVGQGRLSISDQVPGHMAISNTGRRLLAVFGSWIELRDTKTEAMLIGKAPDLNWSNGAKPWMNADGTAFAVALGGRTVVSEQAEGGAEWKIRTNQDYSNFSVKALAGGLDSPTVFVTNGLNIRRLLPGARTTDDEWPCPEHADTFTVSPNLLRLAVANFAGAVRLIPIDAGPPPTGKYVHPFRIRTVGKERLTIRDFENQQLLDAKTGRVVRIFDPAEVLVSDISPTGEQYSCLHRGRVEVRRTDTNAVVWKSPVVARKPKLKSFFSPDGKRIYVETDQGLKWWSTDDWQPGPDFRRQPDEIRSRPNRFGWFATYAETIVPVPTGGQPIFVVDPATGSLIRVFDRYHCRVDLCPWTPDGRWLVCTTHPFPIGSFPGNHLLLARADGKSVRQLAILDFRDNRAELSLAVSPDSRTVAVGATKNTQLFEVVSGALRYTVPDADPCSIDFHPQRPELFVSSPTQGLIVRDLQNTSSTTTIIEADLSRLLQTLQTGRADAAFVALGRLSRVPELTVPFVRKTVPPAVGPNERTVAGWIAALDSPEFAERSKATAELNRIAPQIRDRLQKALAATPSVEQRQRLEAIVRAGDEYGPATVAATRLVELIEWCGTADGRNLLREWAGGASGARLTVEARNALERSGK